MKKDKSVEANLEAAKTAALEMARHWRLWNKAHNEKAKMEAIAAYAAAFTSCKVYIENYLKHTHPNESKMPTQLAQLIRKLVGDMDIIERMNEKRFELALQDIAQLSQKAA